MTLEKRGASSVGQSEGALLRRKLPPDKPEAHQSLPIRKSTVDSRPDIGTGYGFRSWTYLRMWITPDPAKPAFEVDICGDTGCSRSLVDRKWLSDCYPQLQVRKRATPLPVRGIGKAVHLSYDYVILQGTHAGAAAFAFFEREVGIVEELAANMLVGMDILGPEKTDILLSENKAVIHSCGVTIPIETRNRQKYDVRVRAGQDLRLKPRETATLHVTHAPVDQNQDYIFEPSSATVNRNRFGAFALLATGGLEHAIVTNDSPYYITLRKGQFVGHLVSIDPECETAQITAEFAEQAAAFAYHGPDHAKIRQRRHRNRPIQFSTTQAYGLTANFRHISLSFQISSRNFQMSSETRVS